MSCGCFAWTATRPQIFIWVALIPAAWERTIWVSFASSRSQAKQAWAGVPCSANRGNPVTCPVGAAPLHSQVCSWKGASCISLFLHGLTYCKPVVTPCKLLSWFWSVIKVLAILQMAGTWLWFCFYFPWSQWALDLGQFASEGNLRGQVLCPH